MSADNFIGVSPTTVGNWMVTEGSMSCLLDSESEEYKHTYPDGYVGSVVSIHDTENEAYDAAFKLQRELQIVEYGVIQL